MESIPEMFALAIRQHQAGNHPHAEMLYRRILDRMPDHAGALHLLGVLFHQQGRDDQAVGFLGRAIALEPDKAIYRNNHGVALKSLGRLDEAIIAYREALGLRPDYADAHANLGVALHERGEAPAARASLEAALRLRPDHADALYNLANLLHEQGQFEQAIALYRRAAEAAPQRGDVWNNLGNALLALERLDEAIGCYRQALEIDPGAPEVHANLGAAYAQQDRDGEAARCYEQAARLRPDQAIGPLRIAALCPVVFPNAGAIDHYRDGLEAVLDAHRGVATRWGGDIAKIGCAPSFNLAHHGHNERTIRTKFAAVFANGFPGRPAPAPSPGMPRIGFVTNYPHQGGFLQGAVGLINHLDPCRFRPVVCVSARVLESVRQAIRHPAAEFVAFPDRFDAAVAALRSAHCDLLYHWQVGTDALNYFLPFARAAPVQCTSWWTHATTGIPAMDYYLSSALAEVPEAQEHYSETLVRLATLPPYQYRAPRPDPPANRGEFGLPADRPIYVCPQRLAKFHPDFDAVLAGVLRRDGRGIIVLPKDRWGYATERLAARFRSMIPDVADRIVFLPRQNPAGYYRLISVADAALDTRPFGSGLTAYDALSLGLPLVTWPGRFLVGRFTLACYRKMGLMDLVLQLYLRSTAAWPLASCSGTPWHAADGPVASPTTPAPARPA